MGKRTREKSSLEIRSKIQRLEKELQSRESRNNRRNEFEDDPDLEYYSHDESDLVNEDDGEEGSSPELLIEEDHVSTETQCHTGPEVQSAPTEKDQEVPSEILAVLGEAKKSDEIPGKKIPAEVSQRWEKILVDGLAKELKDGLINKILIPENFQLAKAPKLNAEVASIISEATKNRDKRLEKMQQQLGVAIAGLANLTSELISNDMNKLNMIKNISEINQILLDLHYEETMNRRRLLIPMLDKTFINIIQGVKREKFLFGDNLGDNIKTTKSIEKASLEIKKSQRPTFRRPANQPGNFRAPPRQAIGAGVTRGQCWH